MCMKQVILLLIWVKVAAREVVKSLYNLAIIICAPNIQIGFPSTFIAVRSNELSLKQALCYR